MRNIEASSWLTRPELAEIKLVQAPGQTNRDLKINAFTLSFQVKRAAPAEAKAPAGAKPPAGAPAAPPKTKAAAPEAARPA